METIRAYILSVTAAAILCGVVNILIGKSGTIAAVTRFLSGLVLAIAAVQPLLSLELDSLNGYIQAMNADASDAVAAGTELTRTALAQRIKEQTEAYILDKASSLNLDISVEVLLDDAEIPCPVGVNLAGDASPYAKNALQTLISDELGIPKEDQTWT